MRSPSADRKRVLLRESRRASVRPVAVTSQQRLLGEWRLMELIAASALSRVYACRPAHQENDGDPESCDYAIKELTTSDEAAQARFRREAALGKHLVHANVMPTLDVRLEDAVAYLVMPRIRGATLGTVLREHGPFTIAKTMWIARQLAEALTFVHDQRWIHADIKPDNVLLSHTGHVTLFDFGLAVSADEAAGGDYDVFHGTMQFAAPELFSSTRRLGAASDIYSLGATIYQMLTAHAPFECDRPEALAQAHLQSVAPSARSYLPHLPAKIARLVERMLSKEPSRRPTSSELLDELIRFEVDSFTLRSSAAIAAA